MLFLLLKCHTSVRNSQKRYKISGSSCEGLTARILIKPYENEHFRWFVTGETGPSPDCPRSRCARHRAPRATRKGNTHFHSNALVAPSAMLRRLTGVTGMNRWNNHRKYHALGDMMSDTDLVHLWVAPADVPLVGDVLPAGEPPPLLMQLHDVLSPQQHHVAVLHEGTDADGRVPMRPFEAPHPHRLLLVAHRADEWGLQRSGHL